MQPSTETHELPAGKPAQPPVAVELGDGSRLVLEDSPIVCRVEGLDKRISLEDALQLSGQPFAGFRLLR